MLTPSYHRRRAWFPTRLSNNRLIWLTVYYITPTPSGYGEVIDHAEYTRRITSS
jgi:hypothetical protein